MGATPRGPRRAGEFSLSAKARYDRATRVGSRHPSPARGQLQEMQTESSVAGAHELQQAVNMIDGRLRQNPVPEIEDMGMPPRRTKDFPDG